MANLKGLIQLHRFQLDEKRLALTEFQKLADALMRERAEVDLAIAAEGKTASESDGIMSPAHSAIS